MRQSVKKSFIKLSSRVDTSSARTAVINEHASRSDELHKIQCKACQLAEILRRLNEDYSASKASATVCRPFIVTRQLDTAVRRAIIAYRQLGLALADNLQKAVSDESGSLSMRPTWVPAGIASFVVGGEEGIDDDVVDSFNVHQGLMKHVRDRCCQQSRQVERAIHRATIYQVMGLKELKLDSAAIASKLEKLRSQVERDNDKLRCLTDNYRQTKNVLLPFRYAKLKQIIKEATEDYRHI